MTLLELQQRLDALQQLATPNDTPDGDGGQLRKSISALFAELLPDGSFKVTESNKLSESILVKSAWKPDASPIRLSTILTSLLPAEASNTLKESLPQKSDTTPDIVSALDKVSVSNLLLELNTDPLSLYRVDVGVQLGLDWVIVKGKDGKGLVEFNSLGLELSATVHSDEWELSPYLTGAMTLAGGKLSGLVDLNAKSFFCVLGDDEGEHKKNEVNLKQLMTEALDLPENTFPFKEFALTRFEIWGDISGGAYGFDIGTTFSWDLPQLGNQKVTIRDLFLKLEYDGSLTPALGGSLEIFKMTFGCRAAYLNGWEFEMTALNISLTDLLTSILGKQDEANQFPKVSFPALELKFRPSTGWFSFHGEADATWDKPFDFDASFHCRVKVDLERRPTQGAGNQDDGTRVACTIQFEGVGKYTVDGRELQSKISVIAKNDKGPLELDAKVFLSIEGLEFKLSYAGKDTSRLLVGSYEDTQGHEIVIDSLIEKLLSVQVNTGLSLVVKSALLAYASDKSGPAILCGINIGTKLDLGRQISKIEFFKMAGIAPGQSLGFEDLRILYVSESFPQERLPQLPTPTPTTIDAGFNFSAKLNLGSSVRTLSLPAAGAQGGPGAGVVQPARPEAHPPAKPVAVESSTKWFDIQQSLGPLYFGRVGFQYRSDKKTLNFLLDSSVDLLGLRVGLLGLRVGAPISTLAKFVKPDPNLLSELYKGIEFGLEGLELNFERGPVQIGGGLLRVGENKFVGSLLIKTAIFSIFGFGAYETADGQPSLFLFAILDKDLGGPPCFHVTALAAGFGYNRKLLLPPIDKVENFALVQAALKPEEYRDLSKAITRITNVDVAKPGEYWLAVGVRFTSFEMIESFALLTVGFGTETVISILGLSRITVPAKAPPEIPKIAYAELALKVSFRPESGVLTAEALLTSNSYVFTKDCKLTGGFAFYAWFKELETPSKDRIAAGDFVVTLGGYHPEYKPPGHYPIVPRLGLAWKISENLQIAGEVYFALTPSCLMLGGRLSALFSKGNLRAWFDAYAHFFAAWQPLKYDANIGLWIGISYSGFTLELVAKVHLWGPPFRGEAEIRCLFVSFTVEFGDRSEPKELSYPWSDFKKDFLPPGDDSLTIAVVRGLVKEAKDDDPAIVNPYQLKLLLKSAVPSKSIKVNGNEPKPEKEPKARNVNLGIRPMKLQSSDFGSLLEIQVYKGPIGDGQPYQEMITDEVVVQSVPVALWGAPKEKPDSDPNEAALIGDVHTGAQLVPPKPPLSEARCDINILELDRTPELHSHWALLSATSGPGYLTADVRDLIKKNDHRTTLLQKLIDRKRVKDGAVADPARLSAAYEELEKHLQDTPVQCGIGMLPGRTELD